MKFKDKLLWIVVVFIIIGFALRIYGLFASEFFRDEAFSALVSQKDFSGIINTISTDSSAPLLYFLQHIIGELFGFTTFTMRLPSFIAGIISFIYFWKLINLLSFKKTVKYFLLIIFCINPVLIYYSVEARFYGVFIAVFVYQLYLLTSIWKKKQISAADQIKFILSSLIGVYNHNLYWLVMLIWGIAAIFYIKATLKESGKVLILKVFLPLIIVGILFLPWVPILLDQFGAGGNGNWLQFDQFNTLAITLYEFSFWPAWISPNYLDPLNILPVIIGTLTNILVIVAIIKSFTALKYKSFAKYSFIFLFILSAFFLVSYKMPIFYIRYLSFITPLFILLVGLSIESFGQKIGYILMIAVILLTCCIRIVIISPNTNVNINVTKVIEQIDAIKSHGNYLVVNKDALTYFNMEFYGKNKYTSYIYDPSLSTPTWVGKSVIPNDRFITSISDNYDQVFVITDSGLNQDITDELSKDKYIEFKKFDYLSNLQLFVFEK